MFSYRHAFHAGNHADVLKHTVLIALLDYLTQKDTALTVIDTHAGAGLYRLDGDYTATSGEAVDGVLRLFPVSSSASKVPPAQQTSAQAAIKTGATPAAKVAASPALPTLTPLVQAYVARLLELNPALAASGNAALHLKIYPGSPFIVQPFLSGRDKLKAFELHPTDYKSLAGNIAQLEVGRQIQVAREDGFEALKKLLPPPARRALVLCDPSYEMKTDYARVADSMGDALKRFATGTYAVWYPVIPRPEAHDLPRRLKTLATKAGRSWLHAVLTVKSSKLTTDEAGDTVRPGLPASGMFIINPPHTLKAQLELALPQLAKLLAQDRHAGFTLEQGG